MARLRKTAAILLAGLVAITVWSRSALPYDPPGGHAPFTPLAVPPVRLGPFTLEQGWTIHADTRNFGGYSALAVLPDGRFFAGADIGRQLIFARPDRPGRTTSGVMGLLYAHEPTRKDLADLESLTTDPATGTMWGGFEGSNALVRFGADLRPATSRIPPEMRGWEINRGPEAFARLADGRFLAIEEDEIEASGCHNAVLFDRDPVVLQKARKLTFVGVPGFSPVDLVPLDGGRALVLLRDFRLGLPPTFATAIGFIDLDADLAKGRVVLRDFAEPGPGFPRENYEGAALTHDRDGRHLWLISDDNQMLLQRTILLKFSWPERQKARE